MNVIKAPNRDDDFTKRPRVFLAGCANTDWRKDFVKYFEDYEVVFLDPKRDNWDELDSHIISKQIEWEYKHLKNADIIIYWFTGGGVCPITLLEYGMWGLSKGTPIIVGVVKEYEKRNDIIKQTKLARPDVRIVNDLYELSYETKSKLDEIK